MKPFCKEWEVTGFIDSADGSFCYLFEHAGKIYRKTVGKRLYRGLHVLQKYYGQMATREML